MHDKTKEELLEENKDEPEKQKFIEIVSEAGYHFLPKIQEQRFIKTHFPFSLLPPSVMKNNAKVSS